jgi:hypothetical protein
MNEERTFIKITMLIFIANNFHFRIEKLKDITFIIKIWEYINSIEIIKKFRDNDNFEIFNFDVSNINFQTINNAATNLLTSID